MTLERTTYAAGDTVLVTYTNPIESPPGEDYWITLVPSRDPDNTWGDWHYVPSGTESDGVVARAPGDYEIRLHSGYPRVPYHVVARIGIHVQ